MVPTSVYDYVYQPQETNTLVLELDEMWHYLKKTNLSWKALCRGTGELIAWECGDRDKATLGKRRCV